MYRSYKMLLSLDLDEVLGVYYDIYEADDPGVQNPEKKQRALDVLQQVNPLAGDALLDQWLYIPRIPELPFLPPPRSAAEVLYIKELRTQHGVRTLEDFIRADQATLDLPSNAPQDIKDFQEQCTLVRVSGVSQEIAVALHAAGYETVDQVAALEPSQIDALLTAGTHLPGSHPFPLTAGQYIARHAALHVGTPAQPSPDAVLAVTISPGKLEQLALDWENKAESTRRIDTEQDSAQAIAHSYRLARLLMKAHGQLSARQFPAALKTYDELFDELAARGGLALAGEDVSPQDALAPCRTWLESIDPDDLDEALIDAGLDVRDRWRSVDGFTLDDLKASFEATTFGQPIWDEVGGVRKLGRAARRAAARSLASTFKSDLSAALAANLKTPVGGARPADFGKDDHDQFLQNLGASKPDDLERSVLSKHAQARHVWSSPSGVTAAAQVKPGVLGLLPAPLADDTTIEIDQAFVWGARAEVTYGVTLNKFEGHYGALILDKLTAPATPEALLLEERDLLDPGRFVALLPTLLAVHVPLGMARAAAGQKKRMTARALRVMAAAPSEQTIFSTAKKLWVDKGLLQTGLILTEQNAGEEVSWPAYLDELRSGLYGADRHYKDGQYQMAAAGYAEVLAMCEKHPEAESIVQHGDKIYDAIMTAVLDPTESFVPELSDIYVGGKPVLSNIPPGPVSNFPTPSGDPSGVSNPVRFADPYQVVRSIDFNPADIDATTPTEFQLIALDAYAKHKQLEAGLNWLGHDELTVPAWSFEALAQHARRMAGLADQWQQRARALLEASESGALTELEAAQGAEIAAAQEAVSNAAVSVAKSRAEEINLAAEHFSETKKFLNWNTGFEILGAVSAVAGGFASAKTTWATGYKNANWHKVAKGSKVTQGVSSSGSGLVSTAQSYQDFANTVETFEAQKEIAAGQVAAAVAGQAAAQIRTQLAQERLERLLTQELNSAAYGIISASFEELAEGALRLANEMAWLAQRSYHFETRTHADLIKMSYHDPETVDGRFTGAARMLADLELLASQAMLAETNPYQLIKTTISLAEDYPGSLAMLRQVGSAPIRLTQRKMDERFPGLYLHQIRHVEVDFDGRLPASGVHAMLHTASAMRVRTPNDESYVPFLEDAQQDWCFDNTTDAPYVMAPVFGRPHTKVISDYRKARDGSVLTAPPGALDTLEHVTPDSLWVLDLPDSSNTFDFNDLADVRLTIYFTAKYDRQLADAQLAHFRSDTADPMHLGALARGRDAAAYSRREFREGLGDPNRVERRLFVVDLEEGSLRPNLRERRLENIQVELLGVDADRPLEARLSSSHFPSGAWGETDQHGQLLSTRGEPTIEHPLQPGVELFSSREQDPRHAAFNVMADHIQQSDPQSAAGRWVLKVHPEKLAPDSPWLARDEVGDVRTQQTHCIQLGSTVGVPASATLSTETWKHARASAIVQIDLNEVFELTLRSGSAEPVLATLTANAGTTDSTLTIQLGAASWTSPAESPVDPNYEFTLEVVGDTARVWLDRILVLETSGYTNGEAGGVMLGASTGKPFVHELVVERLRYDGESLDAAVLETFDDLSDWVLTSNVTQETDARPLLDLTDIDDILTLLTYEARPDDPTIQASVSTVAFATPGEKYLVDAGAPGTALTTTSQGRYDGTGGSVRLVGDPGTQPGDSVGVARPYCVNQEVFPTGVAIVGEPSQKRDNGFLNLVQNNGHGVQFTEDFRTLRLQFTANNLSGSGTVNNSSVSSGASGWIFNTSSSSSGRLVIRHEVDGLQLTMPPIVGLGSVPSPLQVWVSRQDAGFSVVIYDANDVLVHEGSVNGSTDITNTPVDWFFGHSVAELHEILLFEQAMTTAEMKAAHQGATTSATHHILGARSGVYSPDDPAMLVIEAGTGADVTLVEDA